DLPEKQADVPERDRGPAPWRRPRRLTPAAVVRMVRVDVEAPHSGGLRLEQEHERRDGGPEAGRAVVPVGCGDAAGHLLAADLRPVDAVVDRVADLRVVDRALDDPAPPHPAE